MPRLAIAAHSPDVFVPRVKGVDPITRAGTFVPSKKALAVRNAARRRGIPLKTL